MATHISYLINYWIKSYFSGQSNLVHILSFSQWIINIFLLHWAKPKPALQLSLPALFSLAVDLLPLPHVRISPFLLSMVPPPPYSCKSSSYYFLVNPLVLNLLVHPLLTTPALIPPVSSPLVHVKIDVDTLSPFPAAANPIWLMQKQQQHVILAPIISLGHTSL